MHQLQLRACTQHPTDVDEFVEVAVPLHGVLVLEVGAARPELVARARVVGLLQRVLNKLVDPLVHVVVVQARVVVDLVRVRVGVRARVRVRVRGRGRVRVRP